MKHNDPRHGKRAGYVAGCREDCCREPHLRYQKRSTLRRLREGSQRIDATPTRERLAWWGKRGVTPNAVGVAAHIGEGTVTAVVGRGLERVLRSTERAVLAVTWDDLPPRAKVNAELTQRRIFSLMASGHPLEWICTNIDGLSLGGKWRTQENVTLGLARGVMELAAQAPAFGPSKIAAVKARNRGHLPIAGWDDPGVPALPPGWKPQNMEAHGRDIDEVVVLRLMRGERIPSTRREKDEAMRRWRRAGRSERELCLAQGWHDGRYGRTEGAA